MGKLSNDLLTLIPMEEYKAPALPTYAEDKPNLEKKIPSRWKNKAIIAATAGFLATTALTGCSSAERGISASTPDDPEANQTDQVSQVQELIENTYITSDNKLYCQNLHHGGASPAPVYIVHLTEQEVLEMIRNQLEEVGLDLNEVLSPPSITIDDIYSEGYAFGSLRQSRMFQLRDDIDMKLLDDENEIGIALVGSWGWGLNSTCTIETRERITQRFLDDHGIPVGVFFHRSSSAIWDWDIPRDEENRQEIIDERVTQSRIGMEDEVIRQIQDFIEQLREEGVIG